MRISMSLKKKFKYVYAVSGYVIAVISHLL